MKHQKLYATVLALIGLSLMYQAAKQPPEKTSIGEIDETMVGQKVTVYGQVQNFSTAKNTLFFTLVNGSEKIKAISFRENMLITDGSKIRAEGKITLYKGETELIVNSIEN